MYPIGMKVIGQISKDGKSVEFSADATNILWRNVGDVSWQILISKADLKGADGASVELQKTATHVQWRKVGDSTWVDLFALSDVTGPAGAKGDTGVTGVGLSPGTPTTIAVSFGTGTRPADTTKPYVATITIDASYSIAVAGTVADVCELWISPSSNVGTTGGNLVSSWRASLTGILTLVGAGIGVRSPLQVIVPAGWYFAIRRTTTGTATIQSATYQYMT